MRTCSITPSIIARSARLFLMSCKRTPARFWARYGSVIYGTDRLVLCRVDKVLVLATTYINQPQRGSLPVSRKGLVKLLHKSYYSTENQMTESDWSGQALCEISDGWVWFVDWLVMTFGVFTPRVPCADSTAVWVNEVVKAAIAAVYSILGAPTYRGWTRSCDLRA